MDEDDNISNADISIDDDEDEQQRQQDNDNNRAAASDSNRNAAADDDNDDDESSDVDLPLTYVPRQRFVFENAGNNSGNNAANAASATGSEVDRRLSYEVHLQLQNIMNRSSASTTSASASAGAGASASGSASGNQPTASGSSASASANASGGAGGSPFHDWDSRSGPHSGSSSASGSSNSAGVVGAGGSQATANAEESNEANTGGSNTGARPSFLFDTSSFVLRSRKEVAALINAECSRGRRTPDLDSIMDTLFIPGTPIDNPDNIEWIRWLIAGGRTPKEFVKIVRSYDNHAKCGLVWVPHVVAYRCRTCGISPCMSICRDCFKKGNHTNHDFNMFLSQAGGACDCGDTSVMKAEGFCSDHGINNRVNRDPVPNNLLAVAEAIMPKLLFRLLQHFREHSDTSLQPHLVTSYSCEPFANMLIDLNNMGEIMRKVMTRTLINPDVYTYFMEAPCQDTRHWRYLKENRERYQEAVDLFPNPEPPDEYRDLPALGNKLVHTTLLEEFIFWTFKFEFPQTLVCFLLNMLPDQDYKEHLTRTFVMHYSRIPSVLEMSRDPDTLSNRVVHMSVQLFSNESLALKMVNELSLLHVMIISLKLMMSKILIQNTLHDPVKNFHSVIDCTRQVMKDHCYWPLVSDFNNVLSHESVALVFLRDDNLIDMWFQFLQMLQGMNVNVRETASHVEFEPNSYYAAFSCELEASAYPMWSIISHLQDGTHAHLAKKIINYCVTTLHEWLDAINFREPKLSLKEMMQASFHFPLHRYLAAFVCQAVTKMGISLREVLPSRPDILPLLMIHPLRVQSFFYEILAGKWVRNGLQIKGQAMTYIQANFCNSMADMDLFFLQICATNLSQYFFLQNTIELFDVGQWLQTAPLKQPQNPEQSSMLEGFLTFLATLVTSRTNLGNDEATQCIIEISALLATENKTHSQLLELMPERSGNVHTKNFETFLKKLSVYKAPSSGSENLEQGLFTPIDEVWEEYYDPLHVLLRAVHRRDFQSSLDRFTNYVKSKNKMPASGNLWPPFRLPLPVGSAFTDPCRILNSRVFHSTILSIFYRAVHTRDVSEHLLALAVFLLEIAVETSCDLNAAGAGAAAASSASASTSSSSCSSSSSMAAAAGGGVAAAPLVECEPQHKSGYYGGGIGGGVGGGRREPPILFHCYPTDNLSCNLRHVVNKVALKSRDPQVTTSSYRSNHFYADIDFDEEETPMRMIGHHDAYGLDDLDETTGAMSVARNQQQRSNNNSSGGSNALTHRMRMEVALVPDLSVVAETGVVLLQPADDMDDDDDVGVGGVGAGGDAVAVMDMGTAGTDGSYHHFPLPQITLPESGMEVAIRRDLLLAETERDTTTTIQEEDQQRSRTAGAVGGERQAGTGATAATGGNEMFSPTTPTGSGMLLTFPRVRLPVAVPSSNMDIVPSNVLGGVSGTGAAAAAGGVAGNLGGIGGIGAGGRQSYDASGARKRTVDIAIGGPAGIKDELHVDESILSLLLKLHSQLSGNLDSFSLSDETTATPSSSAATASSPAMAMDVDCNEAGTSTSTSTALAERTTSSGSNRYQHIQVSSSRIGDGPFFIGNLLRKIATRDEQCAQSIDEIRARLWPNQREKQAEARARETKEKEERRKKARERQQKMMQDFANKQKQFMQSAAAAASSNVDYGLEDDDDEAMLYEEQPREKEYDCIICNCTTPSTETNPIGLVVLVESSGIVGHRRRIAERLPLPLNEEDSLRLMLSTRLATEFARRTELLSLKFGDESWYLSNNMAYDNGVHVQSCGHHVHLSCLEAYLKTLYTTQRQPVQDRGEFYCPVCRQLSNSVLPLSPQLDRPMHLVRTGNQSFEQLVADLTNLIKENETVPQQPTKLTEAMGHAMEVMTNIAQRKVKCASITFRKLFIFVTSIARTNLEAEIIQRGGSLCTTNATRYKPKRDCIVPLLHVLSVHVRVLVEWPLWSSWASLAGMPVARDVEPLPAHCRELIPSLLADPIALLLKFILLAPLHLDQDYFTCMVKVVYNLLYYQIVMQQCVTLTDLECDQILAQYGSDEDSTTTTATGSSHRRGSSSSSSARFGGSQSCAALGKAMALVLNHTNRLSHLRCDSIPSTSASASTVGIAKGSGISNSSDGDINLKSMEMQLQSLCLPFLRITALLRQHLYRQEMPEISAPGLEFVRLVYYLELVTDSMDWDCFNASKGLCFIPGTELTLPEFWCKQLMDVHPPSDSIRDLILMNQHTLWQQPRLLKLPREYERLFTYYHERPCMNCYKVPKESSICLLCGTIVCLKQNCCAEKECCEAVRHTISCGGGIGIFLVVTSTYIIVIRGRRACLWGSLYLDDFDEEDRDLKRGKPLYLSQDRFNLLESQWLSHKFAHTKHTWVFHRDLL